MVTRFKWRKVLVIFPRRFTHTVDEWLLLNQPHERRCSRWFEVIERSDDPSLAYPPAFRPRPKAAD